MAYTTIDDPTQFFNTLLYTGNAADGSSTTQDITGVGFQPDWVWLKSRTQANHHFLVDSVRGANKGLYSDLTNTENTSTDYLKSFASDGFQVGPDGVVNANSQSYVSWNWLAGGSASSNSDGSITATVSANPTAGFSIISYTSGQSGAFSIGHGLSSAPKMFIAKSRDEGHNWGFYYTVRGTNTNWMTLDTNDAQGNNSADPDANGIADGAGGHTGVFAILNSSTISIGPTAYANSGTSAIGYCFAEVKGYSKLGSYTGNGNTDGTFIYTGFRPAWIIGKRTDVTNNWYIFDNKRNTFNVTDAKLRSDQSSTENVNSGKTIDIVSNGVKIRSSDEEFNASGGTYIYMAFAESPLVNSNSVPNNAR